MLDFDGQECEDALFCTLDTTCQSGGCVPANNVLCDDGDPCTHDVCANEADETTALGCNSTPAEVGFACPFEDEIPCYSAGYCSDLVGGFGCTADWDETLPACKEGDSCYLPISVSSENASVMVNTEDHSDQVQLDDCPGVNFTPEPGIADAVFKFTAPSDGIYRFGVEQSTASLDAVLGIFDGCPGESGATCVIGEDVVGPGGESIVQLMHAGDVRYVVVDGYDSAGSFEFTAEKTAPYEFECEDVDEFGNGIDNDGDSLANCQDPDCSLSLNCITQGDSCLKPNEVSLNSSGVATTIGDTSNFDDSSQDTGCQYGGNSGQGGHDVVHLFTAPVSGSFTFTLATSDDPSEQWDSVLYLADQCPVTPESCLISEDQASGDEESIQRDLHQGEEVYVIVDAWVNSFMSPQSGAYELSVQLVEAKELLCADEIDDDDDGFADCLDPDCAGTLACPAQGSVCDNPFAITALPFVYTGSTTGAGNNFDHESANCPDANNPGGTLQSSGLGHDVVFSYQPSETQSVHIYLEETNDTFDSVLVLYKDSCPNDVNPQCVVGADLNSPGGEEFTVEMEAGATYFVVVDGYSFSSAGTFYLHVEESGTTAPGSGPPSQ
jgi:hypothetical protein